MDIVEQTLTEKRDQLKTDIALIERQLADYRNRKASRPVEDNNAALKAAHEAFAPSLNSLVRDAFAAAPERFQTTFIRAYVRERMPNANTGSLNAAIGRIVLLKAECVEEGKGGKAATYKKKHT